MVPAGFFFGPDPMIPLSISTCWNSHRHQDGADLLRELADLGFQHVELGHGIRFSLWPGLMEEIEKGSATVSSLHNFCPLPMGFTRANPNCYEFSDPSPKTRRRAIQQTKETIDHAARLGAGAVVLHLGSTGQAPVTPSLEEMLEAGRLGSRKFVALKLQGVREHEAAAESVLPRVLECLDELVPYAEKKQVRLGLECREEIEEFPLDCLFPALLARYPEKTVGYWHDFGHAARKDALGFLDHRQHLQRLGPRCIGCHLHDFRLPARDHQRPGSGLIPFPDLLPLIPDAAIQVLELSPRLPSDDVQSCWPWWKTVRETIGKPCATA